MFIIYINDLPKVTQHKTILFADDSTVVFTGNDKSQMEYDINNTLSDIVTWLTSNNLKINLDKTNIMTFKNRIDSLKNIDINYSNYKIKQVSMTRFLGLNIDSNLCWKPHIDTLCSKVNQYSYALYMLSNKANSATVLTAYHGYVAPLLKYGIMFWGNSTNKEYAFRAQKKCIRSICKLDQTDSCRPFFIQLKILTVPCTYIFETAIFVKRNLDQFIPLNSRRHNLKVRMPPNKTSLLNKSILCMAPRIYNHLPDAILRTSEFHLFKYQVKTLLTSKGYYSITEYLCDKL